MLTTDSAHKLPAFPFMVDSKVTAWRAVGLDLGIPYIFINYAFKEGRGWLFQASILWRQEDVLRFCQDVKADRSRKIVDVSLLLPGFDGKVRNWRWAPIKEIWARRLENTEHALPLYIADDGEKFGAIGAASNKARASLERVYLSKR